MKVQEAGVKHQEWGGSMRAKMAEVEWEGLYTAYRGGSHAVHGTWVDVLMSHLEYEEGGFEVVPEFDVSDNRLLNRIARINLEALSWYCLKWLPPEDCEPVVERIDDLMERSERLSEAFEGWLSVRQLSEG